MRDDKRQMARRIKEETKDIKPDGKNKQARVEIANGKRKRANNQSPRKQID